MKLAESWTYRMGQDACCDFFTRILQAANPDLPDHASVLEVGCAELDWLGLAVQSWPSLSITGIDWRGHKRPPASATVIKGDVMTHHFPAASFDLIVSVSALEHIGLGHYNNDPLCSEGDVIAVQRIWTWLKPGGWLLFDVPWNAGLNAYQVVGTSHRIYDDAAVEARLAQGLPWRRVWTGAGDKKANLVTDPPRLKGGEKFYYKGFAWAKP